MFIRLVKNILYFISIFRLIPHYVTFLLCKNKSIIKYEVEKWLRILNISKGIINGLFFLLTYKKEFRNLFYYRLGSIGKVLNIICPKLDSLFLPSREIGKGLFIEHGFSTIVAAEHIGRDVWINQQVTIGYKNRIEGPVIQDNVTIGAGAIILGGINIGSNSIIGAGTVVIKNVPPNSTVVGNPARIIRKEGVRVDIKL